MTTVTLLNKAVPVGGGGYFRLYPYPVTAAAIRDLNAVKRQPAIVYMHPWEFDPDQPVIAADRGNGFRHRVNLAQTAGKFDTLCSQFSFAAIREILGL
jgi:hypothetical protein